MESNRKKRYYPQRKHHNYSETSRMMRIRGDTWELLGFLSEQEHESRVVIVKLAVEKFGEILGYKE